MKTIKKPHGFINEKMYIIPRDLLHSAINHPLLTNLYLTDIGYFPSAKYHYRERLEGSEQYILILNIKGEGFVKFDEKEIIIKENTLLLIPKGISHQYGSSTTNPWSIYWIHFNGEFANLYLNDIIKTKTMLLNISSLSKVMSLFNGIFDTLEKGMILSNIIHSSQVLGYLLSSLFIDNELNQENVDKNTETIINIFEYMQKNLNKNIMLDDLTKIVNLSKSQLTLIFKEKTGFSPIDYFIRMKIQEAAKLLNITSLTVKEISQIVGYMDQYYFSRSFKHVMGVSPDNYRKKQSI